MTPYMTSHAHRDDIGCIITLIYKTSVIDYDPEKLKFLFDNYSVTFLKVEGLEIYSINKFQ